jgi:glycosyltransferase involved in cell wall biosynthesis
MAQGLPVVAGAAAAAASPLEPGRSGFVADSPEGFAEAMAELWRDPIRTVAMGEHARAEIDAQHRASRLQEVVGAFLGVPGR